MTDTTHPQRFAAALAAQDAEMTPLEIAKALAEAISEVLEGQNGRPSLDPAVRLLAHQFAFVCHTSHIDNDSSEFEWLLDACKKEMGHPIPLTVGEFYLIAHPGTDKNKIVELISVDAGLDCILRRADGSETCLHAVWLQAAKSADSKPLGG